MNTKFTYHIDGTIPNKGTVFVFGSNLAGKHGAGAAYVAAKSFGAIYGQGVGYMEKSVDKRSYAIPTKDKTIHTLPLEAIQLHINNFLKFAYDHPELQFFVTRIGCGLAGYKDYQIAPLFINAPENCSFAEKWRSDIKYLYTFHG